MRTGSTAADPHPKSTQRKTASSRPTACKAAAARQNRKADRADRVLLDPIFQAIRKHAGKGGQDHAVAFADAFNHRLTADELPLHDPAGWAALASDFLDFARTRKRGTANVRLFNPDMKQHRSEEHTSELQSLMRISYAVFCLKKKTITSTTKIK